MSNLTKDQRDAMSDDDFAFPRTRQCPLHDAKHVQMAWDMVDRTKGVTAAERAEARRRILRRAKALGIDTKDWNKVKAALQFVDDLSAMSLEVPAVDDHPNRKPFKGVLTKLDEPSDQPPGGSGGKRVIMSAAAAAAALPSLLGMAIDYTPELDGHDVQAKIGVITAATIEGNELHIEGFLYEADFPQEVRRIQASKHALGFSYEIQRVQVEDMSADPLVITGFVFTGAAVLQKAKAAYQTTSITAHAAQGSTMDETQFKALQDSIAALTKTVGEVQAAQAKITAAAGSPLHTMIKKHADALRACADGMQAEGIPAEGVRNMADSMEAAAVRGVMPNTSYYGAAQPLRAAADPAAETAAAETKKTLDAITASVAELGKQVTTLAADQAKAIQAASATGAPERKTVSPQITALLARGGVTLGESDKIGLATLNAAFDKAHINGTEAIRIKTALKHAGAIG
jgi:hypothetical protein